MKLLKTKTLMNKLILKDIKNDLGEPITDSDIKHVKNEIYNIEKRLKYQNTTIFVLVAIILILIFN